MTVVTSLPYWDDPSQAWDTLILDGEVFPGLANVTGGVGRDLDVKKQKGSDGATLTDNGYDASEITIQLRLGSKADWDELQLILPQFHPRVKGGARGAVTISHPATDLMGITKIYIKSISFPEVDESTKIIRLAITAIEDTTKPKEVKKKKPGGGGGGKGGGGAGWDKNDGSACRQYQQAVEEYEFIIAKLDEGIATSTSRARAAELERDIPRLEELCALEQNDNADLGGNDDLKDNITDLGDFGDEIDF